MKRIIMLFFILIFCFNTILFATPWNEEEYENVPAMFRFGAWLLTSSDIKNMMSILLTFAEMYNNVEFYYHNSTGRTGDDSWVICDSTTFIIYKGNRRMDIIFSEPINNLQDRFNNVTPRILSSTIDSFIK